MQAAFRVAWRGLRRDRGLAWIMIAGLAVGVANWQLSELLWRQQHQSGVRDTGALYAVELRHAARFSEFGGERVDEITRMLLNTALTLPDAESVAADPAVVRSVVSGLGQLAAASGDGPAEDVPVRFASSTLFEVFGLEFRSGHAYADGADEVVVSDQLNQRWFAGIDSVGRTVRIGNRRLRIAGVLAPERWPRRYDTRMPRYEEIFLPLAMHKRLRPWPDPILASADPSAFFAHPESAPDVWVRAFVEIPAARKGAYEGFLERFAASRRERGEGVLTARLVPWAEWAAISSRAEGIYVIARGMGWIVLLGCVFNLIRLALVRSGARAADLGVLRALGESRRALLGRQLLEAALMGAGAGVVAVGVLSIAVPAFNVAVPPKPMEFFVDARAVLAMLLCGPIAAMAATLYPAWRFSRMAPAALMRRR